MKIQFLFCGSLLYLYIILYCTKTEFLNVAILDIVTWHSKKLTKFYLVIDKTLLMISIHFFVMESPTGIRQITQCFKDNNLTIRSFLTLNLR